MSNEPMAKRLLDRPADPQQPAGGDAQRMLAALERLETALRERSNALDLMRTDLRETAKLIAKAWDALDAEGRLDNASMLLHGLEASIRRMMLFVETVPEVPDLGLPAAASVATAPPEARHRSADEIAFIEAMTHDTPDATASEPISVTEDMPVAEHVSSPSAEPDRVPTVSNVVAQLGRPDDPVEAAAPARTRDAATAVARLEALVEELAASMPPAGRSPDAVAMPGAASEPISEPILEQPASKPAPEPSQPQVLPEPVLVSRYREARDEPAGPESAPSEAGSAEPPAAAIAPPRYTRVIPEIELLSNLERMVSTPYPEPQLGRAVIFEPEAPPEAAPTRVPDAPRTEAGAASPPAPPPAAESGDGDLEALLFEPQAEPEVDPAALLFEPLSTLDPAAPQPPAPAAPAAAVAPPAPPPAEPHEPNDGGELTWEFEMPTPAALAKPPQPQPAQVQAPPPEPASEPETSWEIEPLAPAAPAMPPRAPDTRSAATRDDPLAPIKAMTDAERIALFE